MTLYDLLADSVSVPTTKPHRTEDQAHVINKMVKDAFLCLWATTLWRSPHKVTLYLLRGSTPIQWALCPRVWSVRHSEWLCFNSSKSSQSGHLFLLLLSNGLQGVMVHFQPVQKGCLFSCFICSWPHDVSWLSTFSELPSFLAPGYEEYTTWKLPHKKNISEENRSRVTFSLLFWMFYKVKAKWSTTKLESLKEVPSTQLHGRTHCHMPQRAGETSRWMSSNGD